MKNDRQPLDLKQLLREVEHAGRNARRQQELDEMIDSLGGAQKRHGFWWWGSRVAAAACILFFVSTAVRVWFIPTDSQPTLVAEAELPQPAPAAEPEETVDNDRRDRSNLSNLSNRSNLSNLSNRNNRSNLSNQSNLSIQSNQSIQNIPATAKGEILLAEAAADSMAVEMETPAVDTLAAPLDVIAQPVVSVAYSPTPSEPKAEAPKRERRSLLGGLFHRDDISHMDGTTLAINLL